MAKTLGVKRLFVSAALFGAGVYSSDALQYRLAQVRAETDVPRVSLEYTRTGAYVNGERVHANGRVGAPRCDFDSLAMSEKRRIGVLALQEQPRILGDYLKQVGSDAWRQIVYTTVRPDVEASARDSTRTGE
jgi:hypothetical protein